MASEPVVRLDRVSAAGWRLLLALCLAYGLAATLTEARYLVAFVLGAALVLTSLDAWRALAPSTTRRSRSPGEAIDRRRFQEATALLDAVTIALFALDADGQLRFMNRAARALA